MNKASFFFGLLAASSVCAAPGTPTNLAGTTQPADCGVASCTTITPTYNGNYLGTSSFIGLMIAAKPTSWSLPTWGNSLLTTTSSVAQRTWAGQVEYRITWNGIEPNGPTDDNDPNTLVGWTAMKNMILQAKALGFPSGVRMTTTNPKTGGTSNYQLGPPDWYVSAVSGRGQCTGRGTAPSYAGIRGSGPQGNCSYYRSQFNGSCATGETCSNLFAANMNEPDPGGGAHYYLGDYKRLATEFAKRIARDPELKGWITHVDISSGHWGECHQENFMIYGTSTNIPSFNAANLVDVIDHWVSVLPDDVALIINFQCGSPSGYAANPRYYEGWAYGASKAKSEGLGGQLIGWRSDGIGGTADYIGYTFSTNPDMKYYRFQGPTLGEPVGDWTTSAPGTTAETRMISITDGLNWFKTTDETNYYKWISSPRSLINGVFGTMYNIKYQNPNSMDAAYRSAMTGFATTQGYRFFIPSLVLPSTVAANAEFSVWATLENRGRQRLFWPNYELRVLFDTTGTANDKTYTIPGDIARLYGSGDSGSLGATSFTSAAHGVTLAAGTYTVKVGIAAKASLSSAPHIRIAFTDDLQTSSTVDARGTRWYSIGSLTVN